MDSIRTVGGDISTDIHINCPLLASHIVELIDITP